MDRKDVAKMFDGIDAATKTLLITPRAEFIAAIKKLKAACTVDTLAPPIPLIFNAFRLCNTRMIKVIIIGQDPYIRGEAMGLSFSSLNTLPPSLKNIYECLLHCKEIAAMPMTGDLTGWARQGVLLLNASLTTQLGISNAHVDIWRDYVNAIIDLLGLLPNIIFIALGTFAQDKVRRFENLHVLKWGHPSPLNRANNDANNPCNFRFCTAFSAANKILSARGVSPINWDPAYILAPRAVECDDPAPLTIDTIWLFTDGGSRANGKDNCQASWAFYITDGSTTMEQYGLIDNSVKCSNNRGEITAIMRGMEALLFSDLNTIKLVKIVSDSQYAIGCIEKWIDTWTPTSDKKNLDLLFPAKDLRDKLRKSCNIEFIHVRSHQPEPHDRESEMWFIWRCNDIVDKLCNKGLGRK